MHEDQAVLGFSPVARLTKVVLARKQLVDEAAESSVRGLSLIEGEGLGVWRDTRMPIVVGSSLLSEKAQSKK